MKLPHIILLRQTENLEPIGFVEDLCVCDEEGYVKIFPDFANATTYREENAVDGRIVEIPVY